MDHVTSSPTMDGLSAESLARLVHRLAARRMDTRTGPQERATVGAALVAALTERHRRAMHGTC